MSAASIRQLERDGNASLRNVAASRAGSAAPVLRSPAPSLAPSKAGSLTDRLGGLTLNAPPAVPAAYSQPQVVYPLSVTLPPPVLRVNVDTSRLVRDVPVQAVTATMTGAPVDAPTRIAPSPFGVMDAPVEDLRAVQNELSVAVKALQAELVEKTRLNVVLNEQKTRFEDAFNVMGGRLLSLETALNEQKKHTAYEKKAGDDRLVEIAAMQARILNSGNDNTDLREEIDNLKHEIVSLTAALAAQALLAPQAIPPPPLTPHPHIEEIRLLKEENELLKAESARKSTIIAAMDARIDQSSSKFLVLPFGNGDVHGFVVNTMSGTTETLRVQVASNGPSDILSSQGSSSGVSYDPMVVQEVQIDIQSDDFVQHVIAGITNLDTTPGKFVKKLQSIPDFPAVVRALIKDLKAGDQREFQRPTDESGLVGSFVKDIKSISISPYSYIQEDSVEFHANGYDNIAGLTFIPPGTPDEHRVKFIDSKMDPIHEIVPYHDNFIQQYLVWGTPTGQEISAFMSSTESESDGSDTSINSDRLRASVLDLAPEIPAAKPARRGWLWP